MKNATDDLINRAGLIRRGNIEVNEWMDERPVGCYLGNGRFGAVLSATGLNLSPDQQADPCKNRSHFRHMDHWGRFALISRHTGEPTSADYLLPLFRLYWEKEYTGISQYHQCHDLYDGVLCTRFQPAGGEEIAVTSWFDAVQRNLFCTTIDLPENAAKDQRICLSVMTPFNPWAFLCAEEYVQTVAAESVGDGWKLNVSCPDTVNHASTSLYLSTNMTVERHETGFWLCPHAGANHLLLSVGEPIADTTADGSLEQTKAQNHALWEQIGWIDYDDAQLQQVWVRSMAYLLTSYDADCDTIQPVSCMGINGFPYNFVPDIANIAPSLLMLGRGDIVRHWVERFAGEIEDMQAYARRLWPEAKGIFPPWELNFGPMEGYHAPNAPMIFFYEAHNTGYLAKLAQEAAAFANDDAWSRRYADPLIDESAKFFRAFCRKEEDGLWHLHWYPCMGRDEAGGVNKDDYLCTLITAKYTFQAAIRCGFDKNGEYARILSEGLAFESLRSERGTLHTCRGADDFGKQKHPVQLEGVASFPTEPQPLDVEIAAYRLRHDITVDARKPKFHGWTLAQLLMVDTNLREADEWRSDWDLLRPSNNTDPLWTQFYESCDVYTYAFYTATHGMVLQSLIRNCVNDYWGRLEIGSCLANNARVRFGDIRTALGVSVSGVIENGRFEGTVTALRDCTTTINGEPLCLAQGETKTLSLCL